MKAVVSMISRSKKHGGRFATGQSGPRILAVVSCFILLVATALLAAHKLSQSNAPASAPATVSVPPEIYIGVVQLAPDRNNRCEQFRLDNKTGLLTPIGSARCTDTVVTIPREDAPVLPGGGGDSRFKAMGDHFRAH